MKTWLEALKEWNAKKGGSAWCIPKAGTKEYEQIRAMMRDEPIPAPKSEKRIRTKPKRFGDE
jgi:hypothetical protein